jgi:hypothetical protein
VIGLIPIPKWFIPIYAIDGIFVDLNEIVLAFEDL